MENSDGEVKGTGEIRKGRNEKEGMKKKRLERGRLKKRKNRKRKRCRGG